MKKYWKILGCVIVMLPFVSFAQDEDDTKRILRLQLYTEASYNAGSTSSDAIRIEFTDDGSNDMDFRDVIKFNNLDENLARFLNGNLLNFIILLYLNYKIIV